MARKAVTLYVDDKRIRLMATAGKNVRTWESTGLEPGTIEGGVVIDEDKVVAKIKKLLNDSKIGTKKVILGMSGLRSLTLAINLPQIPENLLPEAVMRECGRVLPVPLESLYVSWMTIPSPKKRIRVFAAAIPRHTADSLLRAVRRAGLTPCLMDLKPLALARLTNEAKAVIVDVQPTEYDIIIVGGGVPQPIRTIPLTAEGLSWEERLSMIRDDLVRTIEFYDTNNPEDPIAPATPVHVSGQLAEEPEVCKTLSAELGRPVLPLLLPFRYPPELRHNQFAVNAGLALKAVSAGVKPVSPVAKLDNLPPAYQPKSFSVTRVLALTSTVVVFSLAIPLATLIQMNSSAINEGRDRLQTVAADVQQALLERRELNKTLFQTEASWSAFATALETLDRQQVDFNTTLRVVTDLVPVNVALCDINHDGSTMSIDVSSRTETEVLDYARSLDSSGEFAELTVFRMKRTEQGLMRFIILLKVKE